VRARDFHKWTSISYDEMPGGLKPWRFYDYEPRTSGKPIFLPEPEEQPEPLKLESGKSIPLQAVSNVLHYACGPTMKLPWGAAGYTFRAAPSAGALYPYEVYVGAENVEGIDKGIYLFRQESCAIEQVSSELKRVEMLAEALFIDDMPSFFVIITGLVFRSAEKYGDRGYRYALLDCGHLLLNLSWTARMMGFDGTHILDFNDALANDAVGCDTDFEEVFALWMPTPVRLNSGCELEPKGITHKYRSIELHRSAYISGLKESESEMENAKGPCSLPSFDIPGAIRERRSRREFVLKSMSPSHEAVMRESVECALAERTSTITAEPKPLIVRIFGDGEWQVEEFKTGIVVSQGADPAPLTNAALGQQFCGRACMWLLFAGDIDAAERTFGPRAYRHLLVLSGLWGESAYLAASAQGLGACGIGAFCDDELRESLGLPGNLEPLYFVCVGYTG